MNNLRGDQPAKLGLDYATPAARSIRAIVCLHISAYGRDNERKTLAGLRLPDAGRGGLMSLTGEPDGPPARVGASMIDYMTGRTGATGLLACILRAQRERHAAATSTPACSTSRCISSATRPCGT